MSFTFENTLRISHSCKLVPVQYREYECPIEFKLVPFVFRGHPRDPVTHVCPAARLQVHKTTYKSQCRSLHPGPHWGSTNRHQARKRGSN